MRLSKVAVLALIVGTAGSMSAYPFPALAVSDCPKLVELADWGQNSTGDISVAAGESCLFPITMRGTVTNSEIFQKPAHGKLKKLNVTTYEYKARPDTREAIALSSKQRVRDRRLPERRSLPCTRQSNSAPRVHCMAAPRRSTDYLIPATP